MMTAAPAWRPDPQWLRLSLLGVGVWLASLALGPFKGFAAIWALGPTLLLAPLVLVPWGLAWTARPDRHGTVPFLHKLTAAFQPAAAIGALTGLCLPVGPAAAVFASLWFLQTLLLACFGIRRLGWHGMLCAEELAITAGLLYLPTGGFWLVAHTAGWTFGFSGLIVYLTAVHFHFAGFAAGMVAGLTGRLLPWSAGRWRAVYRWATLVVLGAPGFVGLGIAGWPLLEVVAACLLATGVLATGVTMLRLALTNPGHLLAKAGLALSVLSVLTAMSLAAWYALGEFRLARPLPLDQMARWHGWLNAYGFAAIGLVALARLGPVGRLPAPWPPFSRLRGRRVIGADFFDRENLVVTRSPAAKGLLDSLEEHRRHNFDPNTVARDIRNFYEDTAGWTLRVEARWQPGFRLAGRAFRWFAGRVGQLNLPLGVAEERDMVSRFVDVSDAADGRKNVRGWVRVFRATKQPVYVAAYSTHRRADVAYMNIAFPLPGGNLTSILRMDHHGGTGVRLDSRPDGDSAGDEGVYLVGKRMRVRLPLQETITVTQASPAMDSPAFNGRPRASAGCLARHDLWVFGLHYLRLDYEMTPLPTI